MMLSLSVATIGESLLESSLRGCCRFLSATRDEKNIKLGANESYE